MGATAVDFGPTAPAALNPNLFKLTGKVAADLFGWPEVEGDVNIHGPLSFVIPSAPAGYEEIHRRWGKLPLNSVDRLLSASARASHFASLVSSNSPKYASASAA